MSRLIYPNPQLLCCISCKEHEGRATRGSSKHLTICCKFRFLAKGKPLNCLDTSDDLLAVGANGTVLFWDRRKASDDDDAHPSACLAEFSDTHEQEVTQVSAASKQFLPA